jgi:hypothetical protein
MRRSQIRTVPETKPMVVTQYPTSNEPVLYVAPDFQQQGLDRLLGMSDTISGLDRAFNAPEDGDYMRRGDAWTGPQGSINAPEDGDYMRRGAAWVGPQGSINAPEDGNYMRRGAAWVGPQGSIDAPDNRLLYARRGSTWEPAIFAGAFVWSTILNITGNEPIAPTPPPQLTWLIPPDALPGIPFMWMASGTGFGTFFVSNLNLPIMASGLPGNRIVSIEEPVGSGTWVDVATIPQGTNLIYPDTLTRTTVIAAQANRLWSYNPASEGIRLGVRYTGVTNNNGVQHTLLFGVQAQILPLDLNVVKTKDGVSP